MEMHQHSKMLKLFVLAVIFLAAAAACVPSDYSYVVVNMDTVGTTDDGVEYDRNDLLVMNHFDDPVAWQLLFDGEAFGLTDKKHDISAFSFNDWLDVAEPEPDADVDLDNADLFLSFEANRARVPGIADWIMGQDIVAVLPVVDSPVPAFTYEVYFDGSDVGLSTNSEKIDGLTVLSPGNIQSAPTADVVAPYDCLAGVIFLSTKGSYRVPDNLGGFLLGDGSDVLGFCATNVGSATAGFWFRLFDGSDAGLKPRNAVNGLDVFVIERSVGVTEDSGTTDYGVGFTFVSDNNFTANGGISGAPSEVFGGGSIGAPSWVQGPELNFNDGSQGPALNGQIEDIVLDELYILGTP